MKPFDYAVLIVIALLIIGILFMRHKTKPWKEEE